MQPAKLTVTTILLAATAGSLIAAFAVACSSGDGGEGGTKGESGVLGFQYGAVLCDEGCGMGRKVLVGSTVPIDVTGGDVNVRKSARASDESVAMAAGTENCSCQRRSGGVDEDLAIPASGSCEGGTKSCTMNVTLVAVGPGDTKLEILDSAGARIDATDVHVRVATRLESRVTGAASMAGDIYEIYKGESLVVASRVFDGDDALLLSKAAIDRRPANGRLLQEDTSDPFQRPNEATIFGSGLGDTELLVSAPDAPQESFRIRILMPLDAGPPEAGPP